MLRITALLVVSSLVWVAAAPRPKSSRRPGPVSTTREAKDIAERETGGIAVTARRIPLNGASGGWEVDVHMPRSDKGWRCIIDADTHMVYTKDSIPNPAPKGRR